MLNLIKEIADYHIEEFLKLGYAPAGQNGPYKDIDTPMRNTAHWCTTFAFLYKTFEDNKYLEILQVFSNYLLDDSNYGPYGAAICRNNPIDDTNGIIGQAWVIEGLISLYKIFRDERLLSKAEQIFFSQGFVKEIGLWECHKTNGENRGFDIAYNHHVWFAAAGAQILEFRKNDKIDSIIKLFLDKSYITFTIQPSGLFYHYCNSNFSIKSLLIFRVRGILADLKYNKDYSKLQYLEKGYHLFDLFGFALLFKLYGSHRLFNSYRFRYAVRKGTNRSFLESLSRGHVNDYAYPYNSPAYEYPFVAKTFGKFHEDVCNKLINYQRTLIFDSNTMSMSKLTQDSKTLTSRLYEYVRYLENM